MPRDSWDCRISACTSSHRTKPKSAERNATGTITAEQNVESERWRRIQALYRTALGQDAHKRAAYLEEICAGDETLRSEIESLLQHGEPPATLFDSPITQLSVDTEAGASALAGAHLAWYQVIGLLGS